ncbi:hypothetical protein Drorol1_Dr00005246 [Drosera rotundifolia]
MAYLYILLLAFAVFISSLFVVNMFRDKKRLPPNWPVFGMHLQGLWNITTIHDYFTTLLEVTGPFVYTGPWFCNLRAIITNDPADVHYVLIKNFPNFNKGPEFNRIFDMFGDGIFNADADLWKFQRQMTHSFIGHGQFRRFVIKNVCQKIQDGLTPVLDHAIKQNQVIDLQDIFARLTLDLICSFTMGHDPGFLSIKLEDAPLSKALVDMEEAMFFRHFVPEKLSELFKWLNIGYEGKMLKAGKVIDQFIYKQIEKRKRENRKGLAIPMCANKEESSDILDLFMGEKGRTNQWSDKFLRDTILNLIVAGQDTTGTTLSWLFWLISTNPEVESKIEEEVKTIAASKKKEFQRSNIEMEDLSKMVYLHSAMCEALRLYPPVPINHKAPVAEDELPSGIKVYPNEKILFPAYAMGRTKSIWGEDCMEFKPTRWITEQGKLKNELSHKFFSFGAGPRMCLGKEMAMVQVKAVVASLIGKYMFQVVEGHPVIPNQTSITLHMKHGLKVKVLKKCA